MERLKDFKLSARFFDEGYEVFDDLLSSESCRALATKLQAVMGSACILVNKDGIHIQTKNGSELIQDVPETLAIHDQIHASMAASIPSLMKLTDLPVAVSANLLKRDQGHSFRYHFDRNEYTAVLYLSANRGLPLCIHPKIRTDPEDGESTWLYDQLSRTPARIEPEPGRLVCFHARTSLHGVISDPNAASDTDRISLQLAFDTRRRSFEDQHYYGRTQSEP